MANYRSIENIYYPEFLPDPWSGTDQLEEEFFLGDLQVVTTALISSTEQLYPMTVQLPAVDLVLPLCTNNSQFFGPAINHVVDLSLQTNISSFYSPVIIPAAVNIITSLISSTVLLYPQTITAGAVDLSLGLFTNNQIYYSPIIVPPPVNLLLTALTNTQSLYAPQLVITQYISLPDITGSQLYSPIVVPGAVTLSSPFFSNTSALYEPTTQVQAVNTTIPLLVSSVILYPVSVIDTKFISLPDITGTTIFTPSVIVGAVNIDSAFLNASSLIYTPTIFPGAVSLSNSLFNNQQIFYEIVLESGRLKIRVGGEWKAARVKVWNGTAWVGQAKIWNGSQWVNI